MMNKTGFGFLRLKKQEGKDQTIDFDLLNQLVDRFLSLGGDYFDTAYTYLEGESENALRKALVERYPRSSFRIADKLPGYRVQKYEDCERFFQESLCRCGVDFFDVYMLHWLNDKNYAIAQKTDQFRFLRELKSQGRAKQIGFSFHDTADVLHQILEEHPEVDYVQLQINYLDWESESIQAKACYDVAKSYGKKIIIMEPVRGGLLANLPENAAKLLLENRPQDSQAKWAMRFATDLDAVETVLSGMRSIKEIEDNMAPMDPVSNEERELLFHCAERIRSDTAIACTACNYCASHCPKKIPISRYFALYNDLSRNTAEDWKIQPIYNNIAKTHSKASDCIGCGACERNFPQKLPIIVTLRKVAEMFEENTGLAPAERQVLKKKGK
ncbi:MAG: aldo/keto reductase [Oscillospiraceae bacterium]|nr:aldo/keto reductase [Oscillospiraceae bacterium]